MFTGKATVTDEEETLQASLALGTQEGQSGWKPTVSQTCLPKKKPLSHKGPVLPSWSGQAKQECNKLLHFDRIIEE